MLRRMFTLASAVSLLLFLGTVVQWVRSYWVWDDVDRENVVYPDGEQERFRKNVRRSTLVESVRGRVLVGDEAVYRDIQGPFGFSGFIRPAGLSYQWVSQPAPDTVTRPDLAHVNSCGSTMTSEGEYHVAGFTLVYRLQHQDAPRTFRSRAVVVQIPWAAIVVLTVLLPGLWGYRYSRRRRQRATGACKRCGYDLRATPDRCPECGTPVRPTPATPPSA